MAQAIAIGDHRPIEQMIAWNKARVEQYTERTGQTGAQVIDQLMKTYGEQRDQAAVNALIDPVVDSEYRSCNHPIMLGEAKQTKLF